MTDRLRENANLVDSLSSAARQGGAALADAPALLRRILETGAWREFVTQRDDHVEHRRFSDFVTARPLRGLGVDMAIVERIVGTEDPDLLRLLGEADKVGRGTRSDLSPDVDSTSGGRSGSHTDYLAQRLHAQYPDEYERVRAGELTINAAAVLAGIRPRRVSVRIDDAASAARSLHKNMTPEAFRQLLAEAGALLSSSLS